MIIIYCLIFLFFILSFRLKTADEYDSGFFSKESTTVLKGVFALFILLHHLGISFITNKTFSNINEILGIITVAGFFLLSAYGLIKSYYKDTENYWKKILLVKIPKLYILQVVINVIYYLICVFGFGKTISTGDAIIGILNLDIFFGTSRLNSYSWFITTILVVYLLVAIVLFFSKFIKKETAKKWFIFITVTTILLICFIVCKYTNLIEKTYFREILNFAIGVAFALFEKTLLKLINNKSVFFISLIVILGLAVGFYLAYFNRTGYGTQVFAILFCLFLLIFSSRIKYAGKTLTVIGKISLEVYLLQYICFLVDYRIYYQGEFFTAMLSLAIIGATFIMAYLFHVCYGFISKNIVLLFKKIKPINKKEQRQE